MTSASRTVAFRIALVAILLRALVPAGWMPGSSPSEQATLVVCPGAMGDMPAKKAHDQHHALCAYAMAAHAVTPVPSRTPAPAELIALTGKGEVTRLVIATRSYSRQAPRAPPSLV